MGKLTASIEELEVLKRSMTCEEIGKKFGCSAELVRKELHKNGIKVSRRRFDPPAEELRNLYQVKSMREIAEHYKAGETVVFKRLKEHGIELDGYVNHRLKPGREFTAEHRKALSLAHEGRWSDEKNPNWKGGAVAKNMKARASGAYKQWRVAALALKGNICECCGVKQNSLCECCGVVTRLHVHHKKPFSKFPELRFDPENAEVLCPKCHNSRHH